MNNARAALLKSKEQFSEEQEREFKRNRELLQNNYYQKKNFISLANKSR
jgi:hypothetical protein